MIVYIYYIQLPYFNELGNKLL
uniref:Uncharacterized protein n=1 Tax=Lepeophtheirus salmonis TaxID=72036 RepID=A0A0K2TNV4_LEPSM